LHILLSGCISIELEPKKNDPSPIVQMQTAKPPIVECKTCADRETKNCAEEVDTVVYRASCTETCGFPVSVRVPSNCKGDMQ